MRDIGIYRVIRLYKSKNSRFTESCFLWSGIIWAIKQMIQTDRFAVTRSFKSPINLSQKRPPWRPVIRQNFEILLNHFVKTSIFDIGIYWLITLYIQFRTKFSENIWPIVGLLNTILGWIVPSSGQAWSEKMTPKILWLSLAIYQWVWEEVRCISFKTISSEGVLQSFALRCNQRNKWPPCGPAVEAKPSHGLL